MTCVGCACLCPQTVSTQSPQLVVAQVVTMSTEAVMQGTQENPLVQYAVAGVGLRSSHARTGANMIHTHTHTHTHMRAHVRIKHDSLGGRSSEFAVRSACVYVRVCTSSHHAGRSYSPLTV